MLRMEIIYCKLLIKILNYITHNTFPLFVGFANRKQVDAIQQRLLEKVDGVLAVHEFHVWQLAGDRIIASAHIRYAALLSRVDYVNDDLLF